MVRYTEPRQKEGESIRGRKELGQNVTGGIGEGGLPPPTPRVAEVVSECLKTDGLDAIGNEMYVRNLLKEKGMQKRVGSEPGRGRERGGFSSDHPRET